tara:strand:+ start:14958 stop:15698 length:741 start_codon:yes stop_codon:yes gene_type:complete
MKNIYFCGKDVGFQALSWLVKKNYIPEKVVVSSKNDREIINLCKKKKLNFIIYEKNKISKFFNLYKEHHFDWLLSLWNPHILPKTILKRFKKTLNFHPSFVPYCKGSDTAAWILISNSAAGVSLLEIDEKVDEGNFWLRKKVKYKFPISGIELQNILKKELLNLFYKNWEKIYNNKIRSKKILPKLKGSKFTRKETNRDRIKSLKNNKYLEKYIRWSLAHEFGNRSKACLIVGKNKYLVSLNLKKV